MRNILLVEDDKSLGETLRDRLSQEYSVVWARTQAEAIKILKEKTSIDLMILDLGLPDGSGFEIAQSELVQKLSTNLIFLTAQSDAESRLKGYELGAQEFIPKPFHLKELLLRVKHVLDSHLQYKEVVLDDCVINFSTLTVKKMDGTIDYPAATDLKVLYFLIEQSPRPVTRDQIMDAVWGVDKNLSHRTIDNTIVRLKKIFGAKGDQYLRSVRGVGYQWTRDGRES